MLNLLEAARPAKKAPSKGRLLALEITRNTAAAIGSLSLLGAAGNAGLGFSAVMGLIAFVLPVVCGLVTGVWAFRVGSQGGRTVMADMLALGLAAAAAAVAPLAASCGAVFGVAGVLSATLVAALAGALLSILAIDLAKHRLQVSFA